jgi:hypothetical protein
MSDSPDTIETGEHALVRTRVAGFRKLRAPAFSASTKNHDRTVKVYIAGLGPTVFARQARGQSFEDFGPQTCGATALQAPPILASLVKGKNLRTECGSGDTFATLRP